MSEAVFDLIMISSMVICSLICLFFVIHFYGILDYGIKEELRETGRTIRRKRRRRHRE